MSEISGADLIGIRSQAATADEYTAICRKNIDRLTQAYLALQVENVRLRVLLDSAADDIQDWGSYATDYFRTKHDLAGCVAKYRLTPNAQVTGASPALMAKRPVD